MESVWAADLSQAGACAAVFGIVVIKNAQKVCGIARVKRYLQGTGTGSEFSEKLSCK